MVTGIGVEQDSISLRERQLRTEGGKIWRGMSCDCQGRVHRIFSIANHAAAIKKPYTKMRIDPTTRI